MQEVLDFIKNNTCLNPNDYVVVGVSGGPDSMALLYSLMEYRKIVDIKIICAHVHHNLRKESDDEAKFVNSFCAANNIIFEMTKFNYEVKFSESLGHKMRYDFFEKIINKYNAKYLFTAHHGDDLVETILMRMVRGSNIAGYSGFSSCVKKSNYTILRPLITLTKEQIIKYLDENGITYVIDNSNFDMKYTRNRYRKNILPRLKEEDENVHLKFYQFSNLLQEYDRYIENMLPTFSDATAVAVGGNGTYYWNTSYTQKLFTIDFAFDDLHEIDILRLKKVLGFISVG